MYIGRICPHCQKPLLEASEIAICPVCQMPHHINCWVQKGGCISQASHSAPKEFCGNCGKPLSKARNTCMACGAAKRTLAGELCADCGTIILPGQTTCPSCGKEKSTRRVQPSVVPEPPKMNDGEFERVVEVIEERKRKRLVSSIIAIACTALLLLVLAIVLADPLGKKVTAVELSQSKLVMEEGESEYLDYEIKPVDARQRKDAKWSSSDSSVAYVSGAGKVTAHKSGSCTIYVEVDGIIDSVKVTVEKGVDFSDLYYTYCSSVWANYGSNYLSIDTNPYNRDNTGLAYSEALTAVMKVNTALGLPSSLLEDITSTRAIDGIQTRTYSEVTVTWTYHPDRGLEITYKKY